MDDPQRRLPETITTGTPAAGGQLRYCPKCRKNYDIKNGSSGGEVFCPLCSLSLVAPPAGGAEGAQGNQYLARIGSGSESKEPVGLPFGPYRLLEELGRGGMGVVWRAWDTRLRRVVALKQILPGEKLEEATVERFVREAQLAAKLRHPGIVGVHDVGEHEGARYFTTDYIVAQTLDKKIQKGVEVRQGLEWVKAAAEALAYAHGQGVVHRDIKPANFLVDGKGQIFVMDFGLAAEVDLSHEAGSRRARLTVSGQVLGTPHYMSPEQADGQTAALGPATDQCSLGVVLYELLTGRTPYQGKSIWDLLRAIGQDDPVPPSRLNGRVHRDVETICLKALEKDPQRRYATMGDFAADIGRHLSGEPISARPLTGAGRLLRRVARHRAIVIPTAAASFLGITLCLWGAFAAIQKSNRVSEALQVARAAEARAGESTSDSVVENELAAARDAYTATLALDRENLEAGQGSVRVHRRLEELKASRDRAVLAAQDKAASEEKYRVALEEANELLEVGRKGVDSAFRYMYDRNASYSNLIKKVEEGQKPIEEAIAKAPDLAIAHYLLGRCWVLRGRDDEAEACLRKAVELRPEFAPGHYELGRLVMLRSFFVSIGANYAQNEAMRPAAKRWAEEAIHEFDRARSGAGLDDILQQHVARAMGALAAHDMARVRDLAREGIAQFDGQQGVEDLHWLAGLAAPRGSPERLGCFDRAIDLCPTHVLSRFCRGSEYRASGRIDEAIQDWSAVIEISPRVAWAYVNRGIAHLDRRDFEAVIADCTAALDLRPGFSDALSARAEARLATGDIDGAIADSTSGMETWHVLLPAGLTIRAGARGAKGDFDGAIADCTEALRLEPRNTGALSNRGSARIAKGDLEGAITDLTEALKINPHHLNSLTNRGIAHLDLGHREAAVEDFTKALEVAPRAWPNRAEVEGLLLKARETGK